MKNLKQIAILLMLMPLALIAQPIVSKSRCMRIESAEVFVHYPGIQGAPIMRNYTITVVLKKDLKNLPDSVFVDGFTEKLYLQGSSDEKGVFKKGTRLNFSANVTVNTAENAEFMTYSLKSTITGEGECIIRFLTEKKGKKKLIYLRAKTLKKGAEVFAP